MSPFGRSLKEPRNRAAPALLIAPSAALRPRPAPGKPADGPCARHPPCRRSAAQTVALALAGDLILAVEILEGRVPRQLARLVPARDQAPAPRRRAAPPGARPPRWRARPRTRRLWSSMNDGRKALPASMEPMPSTSPPPSSIGAASPRSTDTREPPSASRAPARDRNPHSACAPSPSPLGEHPPRSRCSAACPGDRTQAPRPRLPGNVEPSASHLADAQSQPDSRLALQQALRDNLPNRSASLTLIRTCSFPKIQPSKPNRTNPPCCRKRGHLCFGEKGHYNFGLTLAICVPCFVRRCGMFCGPRFAAAGRNVVICQSMI